MQIRRRFKLFLYAGLVAAAISGCGGSSSRDTVPTTVTIFNAHSLIFRNDSTMTMGYNEFGQLGDGTLTNRDIAAIVPGLGKMTGGAVGAAHTLVFNNQTSVVMAWGFNAFGQIGNAEVSTTAGSAFTKDPKPVQLSGDVADVAAGAYHSLAVAGGSIYAWGYNGSGQLGDGTYTNQITPVKLATDIDGAALPANARKVAAGGLHSLALFDEAGVTSVYAWGDNTYGQLGVSPVTVASYNKPRKVGQITGNVEQIAAGNKFSLALEVVRDGTGNVTGQTLWGWGYGAVGQLAADPATLSERVAGNQETAYSEEPVAMRTVSGAPFITKIATGFDHLLLLFSDGTVQAVGFNFYGQLGNNMQPIGSNDTTTSSYQFVSTLNAAGTAALSGATDVAAFGNHSLALVNGAWYGWGSNNFGQLGNTPPASSAGNPKIPIRVQGF